MLDGFGDVAFSTGEIGQGFYFFDDPVAGTLNFADIDMGDADAPGLHPGGLSVGRRRDSVENQS